MSNSTRVYRISCLALAAVMALIFAAGCYANEMLVRYGAYEQLSVGMPPEPGDPGYGGWGPGFPLDLLCLFTLTIVAAVEAGTLRGYRWFTARGARKTHVA